MDRADRTDPFAELKRATQEYTVYDAHYEKLGRVDDLVVDAGDRVIYIGVKMGVFGTNSTIVPVEIVRVNDKRRLLEVSEPAESIKRAPHFGSGEELTPELENHVRSYFGLETLRPTPEHDPQGPYIPPDAPTYRDTPAADEPVVDVPITEAPTVRDASLVPDERVDVVPGERADQQEEVEPDPSAFDADRRTIEERSGRASGDHSEGATGARREPVKTVGDVTIHRVRR